MKRIFAVAVLWACALVAAAAGPAAVRKQVESSMLVTGTIDIGPDGGVRGFLLDKEEKLPPQVIQIARQAVPEWRFEPVLINGVAAPIRARLSMRMVATQLADKGYRLAIGSAAFGQDALAPKDRKPDGRTLKADEMQPPTWPLTAYGISGTVYVLLRVGRDGKVEDVASEQVNLTVIGSEKTMRLGRKALEDATLRAARRWTFKPPTVGEAAGLPYWKARVPVVFEFDNQRAARYGKWEAYVPGPRQPLPSWVEQQDVATSPDALVDGELHLVGEGPRLLTPLG